MLLIVPIVTRRTLPGKEVPLALGSCDGILCQNG